MYLCFLCCEALFVPKRRNKKVGSLRVCLSYIEGHQMGTEWHKMGSNYLKDISFGLIIQHETMRFMSKSFTPLSEQISDNKRTSWGATGEGRHPAPIDMADIFTHSDYIHTPQN